MTKEKPGTFFLFQMDHLPGEEVGSLVDTLYGWGAANVNVIPTLTKKSRPSHLVLVDAGGLGREALPGEMARLFSTCGHHRLESVHCHLGTEFRQVSVSVRRDGRALRHELQVKVVAGPGGPLSERVEHDSLAALCSRLEREWGVKASLPRIRRSIEESLQSGSLLEMALDPWQGATGSRLCALGRLLNHKEGGADDHGRGRADRDDPVGREPADLRSDPRLAGRARQPDPRFP